VGNATESDEVKTGRAISVGHKSSTQHRYSLEGNQCVTPGYNKYGSFIAGSGQNCYCQILPELDIALHTGLRRSEQYRLTWNCVDFERKLLTVPQSKNGETRHVQLNSMALAAFLLLKRHSCGIVRVFGNVGPRGWFEPAVKNAGLTEFTWHCLRHTFASRLVMAGVDLRTVQELMGHKTIAMTCRYAHMAPSHKLAAVERLTAEPPFTRSN
jgi:integrase